MKVILFGATGMVGAGVLYECLRDVRVSSVLSVSRSSLGRSDPKLQEHLRSDFVGYDDARKTFHGADGDINRFRRPSFSDLRRPSRLEA